MRVQLCEEGEEVDIHPNGKWYQSENGAVAVNTTGVILTFPASIMASVFLIRVPSVHRRFNDQNPVPDHDPSQKQRFPARSS